MTKNNLFYKILFAIEIALLPMVIFANLFIEKWAVGLIIAGILVCKIWREVFKDKDSKGENIISNIASAIVDATLIVFFITIGSVNMVLGVFAVVLILAMTISNILTFKKIKSSTIQAMDSCYVIFDFFLLMALMFVYFYNPIASIALFAIVLTSVASLASKIWYVLKYTNLGNKIKSIFKRK